MPNTEGRMPAEGVCTAVLVMVLGGSMEFAQREVQKYYNASIPFALDDAEQMLRALPIGVLFAFLIPTADGALPWEWNVTLNQFVQIPHTARLFL